MASVLRRSKFLALVGAERVERLADEAAMSRSTGRVFPRSGFVIADVRTP